MAVSGDIEWILLSGSWHAELPMSQEQPSAISRQQNPQLREFFVIASEARDPGFRAQI
jgi:hypothetical protein